MDSLWRSHLRREFYCHNKFRAEGSEANRDTARLASTLCFYAAFKRFMKLSTSLLSFSFWPLKASTAEST